MRVLAIDTSTLLGGIAIVDELLGMVIEVRLNVKSTHSERLMTTVDYALKQSGYTIYDMDFFAVATGPGSFTGMRIGLSTVKGFSYATGKPIVSVLTLEALARNFPFCQYPVCTMLDARKKEVYAALFQCKDARLVRLISEMSVKVQDFLKELEENNPSLPPYVSPYQGGKVVFTGNGAILYRDEIVSYMGEKALFASPEKMVPSPANVACIGIQKALRGEFSDPINLVPFYLRRSEAEIKESDQYK
jgi:tRNA threonylcarbamoyladenosine biosynthesis protein TsaB